MRQSLVIFFYLQAVLHRAQDKSTQKMVISSAAKYWINRRFNAWKMWLERDSRYLKGVLLIPYGV
jgi:hypothetical protein